MNCKKYGHTFRDCKEPIASYGIIAIRKKMIESNLSIFEYLLIRRRDSLAYVDFVRGKYTMNDPAYIQTLFDHMTIEERERFLHKSFDDVWVNLWNSQNTRQYRSEYEYAKKTFESMKKTGDVNGKLMSRYVNETTTKWTEPEWGFPKGRRSPHESESICALREFCEETGLHQKDVSIHTELTPEYEEYTGTNTIRYKHTYYIAKCEKDVVIDKSNRVQTREIGDIGWFPFEEAYFKIRETNPEKRAVLGRIHSRMCDKTIEL